MTTHVAEAKTAAEGADSGGGAGAIAAESSQAERRADDAERELMEWKKMRFMQDRVGEDFSGIISRARSMDFLWSWMICSLKGWCRSRARCRTIAICSAIRTGRSSGHANGRVFKMGQRVHVLLDRIDRQQRRLQFALVPRSTRTPARHESLAEAQEGKAARYESGPLW